jgi:hypothetical protein
MNITDEWRMYDPKDPRTHPEGISRVEMEFDRNHEIWQLWASATPLAY